MENISDKISPMTLAAALSLGGGSDPSATVYYPAGSVTFSNLPALETAEVGAVYDVTDAFTSTVDFKDGGGKNYPAGTDVAIVNVGTVSSPVLKYNCLSGADSPISGTVTGTAISISDATDARLQSLVIKGRSEVSSGNISSVGDNGLDVTIAQLGQTSRKLTLTTGLPLLSVGSVYDEIDLAKGIVIKRCGYADLSSFTWKKQEYDNMYTFATTDVEIDNIKAPANNSVAANMICAVYNTEAAGPIYGGTYDNSIGLSDTKRFRICDTSVSDTTALAAKLSGKILVYELETPVIIPLTSAEMIAWRAFKTFEGLNTISATDSPNMNVTYIKNTKNGQAVADIQRDLQGQIDSMITASPLLTLTAAGWDSTTLQQTVTFAHDTTKRNVIDITIGEMTTWGEYSVRAVSETATGITFECDTVPETALTFKVTSMEVN